MAGLTIKPGRVAKGKFRIKGADKSSEKRWHKKNDFKNILNGNKKADKKKA